MSDQFITGLVVGIIVVVVCVAFILAMKAINRGRR